MAVTKKIGIWMDYTNARLIEFTSFSFSSRIIMAQFTFDEKPQSPDDGNKTADTKDHLNKTGYYRKIAESIQNFNDILLFGHTDAKTELFVLLKKDKLNTKINIEVMQTDIMTDQQQQAFVRTYFTNPLRKANYTELSE